MADVIQSPFVRNFYDTPTGVDNPLYLQDIQAGNQALQTMLTALSGLDTTTDFALFGGFAYTPGSPGTYGPGFLYLNGKWYYQPITFNEGLRLIPNITPTLPISFPADGITRDIYNVNYSQTGTGGTQTPVFATGGDMDAYRIDNKTIAGEATGAWVMDISPAFLGFTGSTGTVVSATFQYYNQKKICSFSFSVEIGITSITSNVEVTWTLATAPKADVTFFASAIESEVGAANAYVPVLIDVTNIAGAAPKIRMSLASSVTSGTTHAIYGQIDYQVS